MNGVHDMGGMHGMGPISHETNEPVFHTRWESRLYAMDRALSAFHKWTLDAWRHHIESISPADYLRMSYYEKWLTAIENRVVQYGFVTTAELAARTEMTPAQSARNNTIVAILLVIRL